MFFLEDSRASIMLYCPPVSCVGCCHHELWSRSCRVSESPCHFPLSVAISCQERRKVHSGQFDRVVRNTFSINNWTLWFPRGWNWDLGCFLQTRVYLAPQFGCLVGWFYELYVPMRCLKRWLRFRFEPCTQTTTTVQRFEIDRIFKMLLKRLHFFD